MARVLAPSIPAILLVCAFPGCSTQRGDDEAGSGLNVDGEGGGGSGTDSTGGPVVDDGGIKLDIGDGSGDDNAGEGGGSGDPCLDAAEAKSNQGCEFWAVDLPNAWEGQAGSPSPQDMQYAVVVANTTDMPALVEVYRGADTGMPIDSAMVPVDGTHEFRLPSLNVEPRGDSMGEAYRIESDLPITAYQFNPLDNTTQVFSNDASLLFPTAVLAEDYAAVTGDGLQLGSVGTADNAGAFVSVVGVEDGTVVDIYPTRPTYSGPGVQRVTLNRGQVYTVVSNDSLSALEGQGNLSGTRVAADKPVAVFSGNVATIEPFPAGLGGGCCADHMEHQMPPLVAWGNVYLAAPVPSPGLSTPSLGDETAYRITGGFAGTQLEYVPFTPPGAPTTIGAYETVRFRTGAAFSVKSTDPDKTFTLTQFIQSGEAVRDGIPAEPTGHPGDPAMIVIPAREQYRDDYIFLVPLGYQYNYVTIYRAAGATVRLDGEDVSTAGWRPLSALDGVAWEYAYFSLEPGQHRVTGDEDATLAIVSVGYSSAVSYGFPGGAGVEVVSVPPPPPAG